MESIKIVMAALVAAIHVFLSELRLLSALPIGPKDVDGRHKAGHDGVRVVPR
jgi:hypothetical protein